MLRPMQRPRDLGTRQPQDGESPPAFWGFMIHSIILDDSKDIMGRRGESPEGIAHAKAPGGGGALRGWEAKAQIG